jgi:hypothetical protein
VSSSSGELAFQAFGSAAVISTDKQADHGVLLDAQPAKIAAYAELYDLELTDIIDDGGQSAKSLD